MDVSVLLNNEKKGKLPYLNLPIYRLFCEQIGIQTRWDQQEKKLHLSSSLQGKKIYFMPMERDDTFTFILEKIKTFLNQTGLHFTLLPPKSSPPSDGEMVLHLTYNVSNATELPRITILHSSGAKGKSWAKSFHQECKKNGFSARIKENEKKYPVPTLELRCKFPETNRQQLEENITLAIVSALLRGLTKDNIFTLFPFLSLESIRLLFPMEQKTIPLESTVETAEQRSMSPVKIENPNDNNGNDTVTAKPNTSAPPLFRMEVYFDYQVFVPAMEDEVYLILGNLHLKNTGVGILVNPLIYFHVTPSEKVQLKGQIVPPKMTDTVGVQSNTFDSAVGWRYAEEDWFQTAKDKGEYWICPIQPLPIPPGEIITFSNFQFSIPKSDIDGTVTIEGIVHFKEQNLQFPANNRIVLSVS